MLYFLNQFVTIPQIHTTQACHHVETLVALDVKQEHATCGRHQHHNGRV